MTKKNCCGDARGKARAKRDKARQKSDSKRAGVRAKVRGVAGALAVCGLLAAALGCATATPASKAASTKACDNVTTINNYIGVVPGPAGLQPAGEGVALGGLTIVIHDLNGTIAQSADTEGGETVSQSASPVNTSGLTGDKPLEAAADVAKAGITGGASGAVRAAGAALKAGTAAEAARDAAGAACPDGNCTDTK